MRKRESIEGHSYNSKNQKLNPTYLSEPLTNKGKNGSKKEIENEELEEGMLSEDSLDDEDNIFKLTP